MNELKNGDTVYAVQDSFGGAVIRTATATSVGKRQVRIQWEVGDAFKYRRHVLVGDPCLATTPEEAVRRAIERQSDLHRLAELNALLRQVEAKAIE